MKIKNSKLKIKKIFNSKLKKIFLNFALYIFAFCLLNFAFACHWSLPAQAKSTTDISIVSVGARSVGMGRAGVAVIGPINNIFVNPAGLSATKSFELTSMSTQILGQVDYKFLSGGIKIKTGTASLSYVGATTPAGYYTTDENSLSNAPSINYHSSILALSYGIKLNEVINTRNLGEMSLGTNLKYFSQGFSGATLSSASGGGFSLDLGLLFEATPMVNWGLNFQNLSLGKMNWATQNSDDIPLTTKVGGAFKLLGGKVLVVTDTDFSTSKPLTLHAGAEWQPIAFFSLRAGLDQDAVSSSSVVTNLTAGAGLNIWGFQVDLAYRQDSTLSNNSNFYLSLSYTPDINVNKVKENNENAETINEMRYRSLKEILNYKSNKLTKLNNKVKSNLNKRDWKIKSKLKHSLEEGY